jgi:hypothetical protein
MNLSDADVLVILDELRRGQTVSVGGSRAHSTYGFREGSWFEEAFDEGSVTEHPIAEAQLLRTIEAHPNAFVPLLRAPHLRRFRAAFLDGDHPAARAALHDASVWGDPFSYYAVWEAALRGPDRPRASDEVKATILSHLRGHTAWHAFWEPMAWHRTPAHARLGLWFLDRLVDLVAPPGGAPGTVDDVAGDDPSLAGAIERQRRMMVELMSARAAATR